MREVVHRQHNAVDRQSRIERGLYLLNCFQKLRQPFQSEELALQRNKNRIRSGHCVDGEQIERRRAVDENVVEILRACAAIKLPKRVSQPKCAIALLTDLKLKTG